MPKWNQDTKINGWKSATEQSNEQWVIDVSYFMAQADGRCHLVAVIDCRERWLGWWVSGLTKASLAVATFEDDIIRLNPPVLGL